MGILFVYTNMSTSSVFNKLTLFDDQGQFKLIYLFNWKKKSQCRKI